MPLTLLWPSMMATLLTASALYARRHAICLNTAMVCHTDYVVKEKREVADDVHGWFDVRISPSPNRRTLIKDGYSANRASESNRADSAESVKALAFASYV